MKTSKAIWALVAVIVVFAIVMAGLFYNMQLSLLQYGQQQQQQQQQQTNKYEATLPLRFTISDMWAGGASSSATVTVYKYSSLEQFDTGTTDSNGVWTTNKAVATGERYWVKVVKGNAVYYYDITVPYATTTGQVYHYKSLDFYTCGTYAITMQMPNGTTLSDGSTYNITQAGETYPTFTVMIRNTASSDSGVRDYYDPIKSGGVQRETLFIMKVTGNQYESLLVQNLDLVYQSSSARYYGFKIDPMNLVLDKKPDGTYNTYNGEDLDGIWTFSIQFDCSGLTANSDGPEIEFYLYTQDNMATFQSYGTHLSDAVGLNTSFNWEIDA